MEYNKIRLQIIHGENTDWNNGVYSDLILQPGEPAVNLEDKTLVIGDGISNYAQLPKFVALPENNSSTNKAIAVNSSGKQVSISIDNGPTPGAIVLRTGTGQIRAVDPLQGSDVVTLNYLNSYTTKNSSDGRLYAQWKYDGFKVYDYGSEKGITYNNNKIIYHKSLLAEDDITYLFPDKTSNDTFAMVSDITTIYKHTFQAARTNDSTPVWISFLSTSSTKHIVTNDYGEITLDDQCPGWDYRLGYNEGNPTNAIMLAHLSHTDFNYKTYSTLVGGGVDAISVTISFTSTNDENYTVTKL